METLPAFLTLCEGNPSVTKAGDAEISCFLGSLNNVLNKQSSCRLFEMPWYACEGIVMKTVGIIPYDIHSVITYCGALGLAAYVIMTQISKVHGANIGPAHFGPDGPRWAPCWSHEPCYQGIFADVLTPSRCQDISDHHIDSILITTSHTPYQSDIYIPLRPLTHRGWDKMANVL